ncbi:Alpha-ketoglutarate-dependent dioxygenase abh1 [Escovopsis weberi]|uniref:Alpha-ketoglutarate-dependent dioxygenase abh1 n=1 Tax=Escovopsis weberi TaxID=150374 RepID=A0A0M9VWF8_ESCWE|nr:Alpha-ketoglutarate-dependent dioxygenase abh1 [Escovopsis weberi]
MTISKAMQLDAHEQPSDEMKAEWKAFSRADQDVLLANSFSPSPSSPPFVIDDPHLPLEQNGFKQSGVVPASRINEAFSKIIPDYPASAPQSDCPIIHHPLLPGLLIIPNLIPPSVQVALLDTMLHRDLSNPVHQTNMHLHYTLPYPEPPASSFFSMAPDSPASFLPKDPAVHKPLSIKQVLQRRLHWVTLGGQYDWTNRVYPAEAPPEFPADLSGFLQALFPATEAQAAIVNFYTPGDTMMMHRDVSEEADRGLVSLSLGCDCLFMIAPNSVEAEDEEENDSAEGKGDDDVDDNDDDEEGAAGRRRRRRKKREYLLVRLRSGDAIYMTQESRYAWHGVPKVLKGTCPDYLADWPAGRDEGGPFEAWRGWMQSKRINLNVRQMTE